MSVKNKVVKAGQTAFTKFTYAQLSAFTLNYIERSANEWSAGDPNVWLSGVIVRANVSVSGNLNPNFCLGLYHIARLYDHLYR